MKPKIIAKLILCFEDDLDMQDITDKIKLDPSSFQRRSNCRINPITKKQNLGFWEIQTDEIKTYDSVDVQNILLLLTHKNLENIRHVVDKYNCEVIYRFFVYTFNNEFPALMFTEELLKDINYLKAKLDVVISND